KQQHLYDVDQPEVHEVVRGFRRVLEEYGGDRVLVGEVWPRDNRSLADYLRPDELQQAFNFRFLFCPWSAGSFRAQITQVEELFPRGSWPTYTLSNHDFPRHITRYADGDLTAARARLAAVMLLSLRGTPFLYYGEELGMPNVELAKSDWRDPVGRDGCRTPMQWSSAQHGGFTLGEPWLKCGDYATLNAARQMDDAASMLSFYRRMIRVRRESPALESGDLAIIESPEDCLMFARAKGANRAIVALNFANEPRELEVPRAKILISSDSARRPGAIGGRVRLAPSEGIVLALE
ncbi:MAG: alpha-amylase family glycosyl hydrolase, partial [Candidatus Binataceae bacterium]